MSSAGWDDFVAPQDAKSLVKKPGSKDTKNESKQDDEGCDWGFSRRQEDRAEDGNPLAGGVTTVFIPVYERYLEDRHSFEKIRTKNSATYEGKPKKALQEWFDNEGHEFNPETTQERDNQHICTIDLPIDEQDFTVTSKSHLRKQDAVDDASLIACKLLDECQLLYSWQCNTNKEDDQDRKRRSDEANKEDDIELDSTNSNKRSRTCSTSGLASSRAIGTAKAQVNTYDTLLAKWNELNMSILQLKARLVKLDTSVTIGHQQQQQQRQKQQMVKEKKESGQPQGSKSCKEEDVDDELDPLDAFMSDLGTKTKLSMDEKIEKSRMKSQIVTYQREQEEVARLLELAKPKFDLNKACLSKQCAKK